MPKKPMSPEKLQELLLKLRKGATAGFNWPAWSAVLSHLGGSVEPIVGLVHVHGSVVDDKDAIRATRDEVSKYLVSALPSTPRAGQVYVTKLSAPTKTYHTGYSFDYEAAVGAEGWLVTVPDGRTFTALPSEYEVGGPPGSGKGRGWLSRPRAKIHAYDLERWLKEIGVKDLAARALGVESHVPAAQRTRANTGTCGVCFKNVKLSDRGRIVLHGYRRPGWGSVEGQCPGTDLPPFEVSPEATDRYLRAILEHGDSLARQLAALESGAVAELPGFRRGSRILPGEQGWDAALSHAIRTVRSEIDSLEAQREAFAELVAKWRPRELPTEGGREINWYVEGRR